MSTTTQPVTPAAQPASANSATQQPTPVTPKAAEQRMLTVKVDGKELQLPESEVVQLASAGKAATQRFQEAAQMRREAEQLIKYAKENPKEFFAKTGMNAREWAEQYLVGELQNDSMSPEQKKAREIEEKLRRYEADEKAQAEKARQAKEQAEIQEQFKKYNDLFVTALNESGLPKTPFTVARMAQLQQVNIKKGLELSASDLAKVVREDYLNEQKTLFGAFDGDKLIEFLGPDIIKKLTKSQIAKLKARGTPSATAVKPPTNKKESQTFSWKDYQRENRRIK